MAKFEHKESEIKKKVTGGRIIDLCASFQPLNCLGESTRPAASAKSCVNFDCSKRMLSNGSNKRLRCDIIVEQTSEDLATSRIPSIFVPAVIISTETPLLRSGAHQRDIY
jgi:hypothetical protein